MQKSIITQAPGRINIIGEHTDYNDGFVLPAAIDLVITQNLKTNGTNFTVNLISSNFGETFLFDLRNFKKLPSGWQNYLMGVVSEVQKAGKKLSGFDCEFGGNIPLGGGVSSSSALQVSFLLALNEAFDLNFSKIEMVKLTQRADHNFIGMMGGIMDQFSILHGKKDHVMLLDCRSLEYKYFPLELGDYQVLLLNTNVSHSLADSAYNTRREECEYGVTKLRDKGLNINSLRDIDLSDLDAHKSAFPKNVYARCQHVVNENKRTLEATQAMTEGNVKRLGELMYDSHESLTNLYKVSCPELDFLVDQAKTKDFVLGGRMMGGGFGGCTISIVEKARVNEFIDHSAKAYREKFGKDLTPLEVKVGDGASVV